MGFIRREYYRFKALALKGALEGLKANPKKKDKEGKKKDLELEKLKKVIVELTMENQLLKKSEI
jgi:hypothetical protein